TFEMLAQPDMPLLRVIPPASGAVWHNLEEVAGNIPSLVEALKQRGGTPPAPLPEYDAAKSAELDRAWNALIGLRMAWRDRDAAAANRQIATLVEVLPRINSLCYPSEAKRHVEVAYNR